MKKWKRLTSTLDGKWGAGEEPEPVAVVGNIIGTIRGGVKINGPSNFECEKALY